MFYKIILKPIDNFYFGGENSFGDSKSSQDKSERYFAKRSAYFAKGEMFPQQTQLLGMLRKTILRKHGCLKLHSNGEWVSDNAKQKLAQELVGLKWEGWEDTLGKLISLSPIHLEEEINNEIISYCPAPYDNELSLSKETGISYINGRKDESHVYAFKKEDNKYFGAKDYLCSAYISKDSKKSLDLDKVFKKHTKTGNQTFDKSEDDAEQLYKMQSYVLSKEHKNVYFVCYLESKDNTLFGDSYSQIVELGGERSLFELEVKKVDVIVDNKDVYISKEEERLILISDTYVECNKDENIFDYVDVALAKKGIFRTFHESKSSFSKTSKKVLLKKGSVFYPKKDALKNIINMIEVESAYRNIGYNQFIIIDKKEG